MNAPAKITLHRPTFQGDHLIKISLAPVPGTTDDKPHSYGKTPLEVYQESRIPAPGAFARIAAPSHKARMAIAADVILAQLSEPRSSQQIAEAIGEDLNRVTKALTLMEGKGLVGRIKRSSHATLWCEPGAVQQATQAEKRARANRYERTRAEFESQVEAQRREKYAQVMAALSGGPLNKKQISAATGFSSRALANYLAAMVGESMLKRSECRDSRGMTIVYEVAQ